MKVQNFYKKYLTKGGKNDNILLVLSTSYADVAQLAEQLTCNQQVIGSSPIIGFFLAYQQEKNKNNYTTMDGFPSGQRGQTVNLLRNASVVRIHLHPLIFQLCGF